MLYLQIASPKSSVLNFLDSNSFEVIISIFQRTEKVPDMERLRYISGKRINSRKFSDIYWADNSKNNNIGLFGIVRDFIKEFLERKNQSNY